MAENGLFVCIILTRILRRSLPVETCQREMQEERINQKMPTQNEFLLVPESDRISMEQMFERSLNRKNRKWGLRILKENS